MSVLVGYVLERLCQQVNRAITTSQRLTMLCIGLYLTLGCIAVGLTVGRTNIYPQRLTNSSIPNDVPEDTVIPAGTYFERLQWVFEHRAEPLKWSDTERDSFIQELTLNSAPEYRIFEQTAVRIPTNFAYPNHTFNVVSVDQVMLRLKH